jgi:hypothetical protein
MGRSRWRPRAAVLLALTLAAAAIAATSATAAGKPFTVVLSPATVSSGQATITATFTNRTGQQQLGSANLTAPSAFTVLGATLGGPGTATVAGNVVQLRNLGLAPGGSISVAVTVQSTGCAGTFAWSVIAKQSNDFNGPPGNNLDLDAANSALTTTVSGGCALKFTTQPQDARIGEHITGSDFDPSAAPVTVAIVDAAGNPVAGATAPITVALAPGPSAGHLAGTLTVNAVDGVASFGDLSIDTAGTYKLLATSAGQGSVVSDPFAIQQVAVACVEDVDCTAQASTQQSLVALTAFGNSRVDAGFLQLSLDAGFRPDCVGYDEFSSDWASVLGPDRSKLVTYQIDKKVMNSFPNNGASFIQMCFAAPFMFATRPGTPLTGVDTDGLPGPDLFVGLLPDCGVEPCVVSRSKTRAGDGVIVTRAPGGTNDPAYRP